ncbi:MAG: 50S ribosomal protein L11 methyltransferase [Solirubrobacterales bacterium]
MYEISFDVKHSEIDAVLNKLISIGLCSTYYDAPYEVTVYSYGYGFNEKEDEIVNLKVYPDEDNEEQCLQYVEQIKSLLNLKEDIKLNEITEANWQQPFEPVDLHNGWIIGEANIIIEDGKNKINFESQGSFGTGLHETTQDFLRYIIEDDFSGKTILDIGTGSGILSIAAALRNAEHITALDIRDVTSEVLYNAKLNNINNIDVIVMDATSKKFDMDKKYDVVFINIGGEETLASLDMINDVLKPYGKLFVSGLVEWSSDYVISELNASGYKLIKITKTNEWVTMVLLKTKFQ